MSNVYTGPKGPGLADRELVDSIARHAPFVDSRPWCAVLVAMNEAELRRRIDARLAMRPAAPRRPARREPLSPCGSGAGGRS